MIGTMQPKVLGEFYKKVFDMEPVWNDGNWSGFQVGNTHFTVGEHSEMGGKSKDPGRVMFNLETKDVQAEFDRIKAVEGAEVIKEPYNPGGETGDMLIATFADPDGNYFQLMTPWEEQK